MMVMMEAAVNLGFSSQGEGEEKEDSTEFFFPEKEDEQ